MLLRKIRSMIVRISVKKSNIFISGRLRAQLLTHDILHRGFMLVCSMNRYQLSVNYSLPTALCFSRFFLTVTMPLKVSALFEALCISLAILLVLSIFSYLVYYLLLCFYNSVDFEVIFG